MLCEAIKRARKAKGFSQEELAVKLNVVRQTVSKWENGLSVPDADILLQMAELLEVPVGRLLGVEPQEGAERDLARRLAELNEELAACSRRERLTRQVNRKRGAILLLSFLSLAAGLGVENRTVSLVLFGGCALAAAVVFYRNLTLFTGAAATRVQLRAVRAVTVFDLIFVAGLFAAAALCQGGLLALSEEGTKALLTACIVIIMLFFGFIAPKLPFNRYTGFRLPWTIRDEDTWNVAHRILGYLALPFALLYLAACRTAGASIQSWGIVTISALLLWVGTPGVLSLIFFWKKVRGKL